jgi:hypothetical protein
MTEFTETELVSLAEQAGFDWESFGLRDRLCFRDFAALVAEKAATKERAAMATAASIADVRVSGKKGGV